MRKRRIFIALSVVGVITLALVLPAFQISRDWAFVDRNTVSRNGYREWFFGWRTGSWHKESALEKFMRASHPAEFRQHWISYAGTGRNVFGGATRHGHGRPGPIVLLSPEAIADYCQGVSYAEKRRLYDVFASGEREKIQALVDQIYETAKRKADSP